MTPPIELGPIFVKEDGVWYKKWPTGHKQRVYEFEVPKSQGGTQYSGYQATQSYSNSWYAFYDRVDAKKWPNTWRWMVKFYFSPSYNKDTRWVSEYEAKKREWQERKTQELKPKIVDEEADNPYAWEGYVGD